MIKKLFLSAAFIATGYLGSAQTVGINPINGNRGQSLPVVISGQGTNFTSQGSATAGIYLSQGSYVLGQGSSVFTNISVIDPLTIVANLNIPQNAPLGIYDLFVTAGSIATESQAFTINQPSSSLITLSPNGSKPGNTTNVTITVPGGSFKTQAQVIEKVWLTMGTEIIDDITNITVVNSTTFTADVAVKPGATNGWWNANIYTDDDVMFTTANAFFIDATFSTPELDLANFKIYPNPAHDFVMVEVDVPQLRKLNIRLTDLTGKSIGLAADKVQSEGSALKLNVSTLPDGVYLIEVTVNNEVIGTRKFIKD